MPIDGDKIRKLRESKKMTRLDLITELDIDMSTLCLIESGKRKNLRIDTVMNIVQFFKIDIKDIYY